MKDTQKRFLGAVLAASSVVGVVAPSVTAMATVVEDENKATAEDLKAVIAEYTTKLEENTIFANYHRVIYAAERLAQYDAAASEAAKANIAQYADKVFTAEVKTILDKMDGFAKGKSMADYNALVTKEINAMENKENAAYLMSRLDVWGKAVVFEVDPNYVKATDAIMQVTNLVNAGKYDEAQKQVVVAKDAVKAIKTYEINGAYLEGQLKIEEDNLAQKANLKVVSAEVVSANEVKVVFNKEVDEDSAENINNYKLYVGKDTEKPGASKEAKLQDDNKTVIVQLNDKIANGVSYKLEVKDVFDVNGKRVEAYNGDFKVFNDKTAAKLISTEYNAGTLKFTFDKAIESASTVKVDNNPSLSGGSIKAPAETGKYEVKVDLPKSNSANDLGKHTVKISGVTDFAGNTADMITTEYTVTEDNEKPVIQSIKDESERQIKVEFNTKVDKLDTKNFEIKKGNHTFTNIEVDNDGEVDSDNKIIVRIKEEVGNETKLYEDDETNVELSVKVKDFKAIANEKVGDDFTSKVTLTKDETAPVVNEALNRVENQKTLVVYFNEDLKSVDQTKISIVRDGIKHSVGTASIKDKRLQIKYTDNLETGKYSITLEKGAVTDKSDNKNEAVTTTVNYTNDNAKRLEVKPVVKVEPELNKNIVKIGFTTKMTDSALDLSNYMVDGVKLSDSMYAGTTVAFTNQTTKDAVEITLARGTVDETGYKAVKFSKDLTTDKGEYIANSDDKEITTDDKNYTDDERTKVKFADDTNPEMEKVEFITNKSADTTTKVLRVKFTKKVTTMDALHATNGIDLVSDFIVRDASGNKITINAAEIGTNDDADTIIIRLDREVSTNKTVTVEVTDNKDDNKTRINIVGADITLNNELETGKKTVAGVEVNSTINTGK